MSRRKPRVRAKDRRRVAVIFLSCLGLVVAGLVFLAYQNSSQNPPMDNRLRAAIVDQLSLTFPNQTFVETATNMLNQSGYSVDYYPGENVTVDLYKNLMASGYKIIIFRVHSGIASTYNELAFFTSENYRVDPKYANDVLYDRIGEVTYHDPPAPGETAYFAIRYQFVKEYGRFNGTTVIVMGCYGMKYSSMAQAFTEKGAKVYFGWDGLENADHADEAAATLLRSLIIENQTVGQAVENTMTTVGADPTYKSKLLFYPSTSANQTVIVTASVASDNITENRLLNPSVSPFFLALAVPAKRAFSNTNIPSSLYSLLKEEKNWRKEKGLWF